MKKIALMLIIGCFFSINIYSKEISSVDQNTQVMVNYYKAMNKGFKTLARDSRGMIAKGAYLDYYGERTDLVKNLEKMQSAFLEHHTEILNIIAEGDQVFVRTKTRAVQKGSLLGVQPTDKPITLIMSNVFQFNKNHQITSMTQIWNEMSVMKQLGFIVLG